jgi:hypothetical protein
MKTKNQKAGSAVATPAPVATPSAAPSAKDLEALIEAKPLTVVYNARKRSPAKTTPTFVVATYWWGSGRVNRNLQRPCPDDAGLGADENQGPPVGPLTAPVEYQEMINAWKRDCEAVGCPYIAQEYPEFARPGMYQTAINAKPLFIKKALETAVAAGYNGVVYIDGDMRFRAYPAIFDLTNIDYMARGWNIDPRASSHYTKSACFDPFVFETSGGIMYFGNTRLSRVLLKEWIKANGRKANYGRADDRIISVIVNARDYLLKANIVQLPIEYLWLTDFYDPAIGGHLNPQDYQESRLICEHPHCLTSEERAREQGAHSDRSHILYTQVVENLIRCQRMGGMFYDYIFFENEGAALDSYQTYLETMESIGLRGRIHSPSQSRRSKTPSQEPCLYHTSFQQRYGKYNEVVEARLNARNWTHDSIFANLHLPGETVELHAWEGHGPMEVLEALMGGRSVLWMPASYLKLKVLEAYQRASKSSRAKVAPSASLFSTAGGAGSASLSKIRLEPLKESATVFRSELKSFKKVLKDNPDAEFITAVASHTNEQETNYQPKFPSDKPMYFSPTSRVLRHLLLMSPDLDQGFNRLFNSSFIFLTGIRCHWIK